MYVIETNRRLKGPNVVLEAPTRLAAIQKAKLLKQKLEELRELEVDVDIFTKINARFVRDGYLSPEISYLTGSKKVVFEGKTFDN